MRWQPGGAENALTLLPQHPATVSAVAVGPNSPFILFMETKSMNRSMTFKINDASTETGFPGTWVVLTEQIDGTISASLKQEAGVIGDLRGFFFDVADESLLGSLAVNAGTRFLQGNDNVTNLGGGATMAGLLGSDGGFDAGIEIGTSGIGKDDVRSFSFVLSSSQRGLTLEDFANVDFGVRLTSVGIEGGSRSLSSKILEHTGSVVSAADDSALVLENATASGNVLANDSNTGTATVTWSDASVATAIALTADGLQLGTLTLGADGSWAVDGNGTDVDQLSAGEEITITRVFDYSVRAYESGDATTWSDDSASFTVTIRGVNDGPVAADDDAGRVTEDAVLNGDVSANDSDVDRLDTHSYSLVEGSFNGNGSLTLNADGSFSYDAEGAYNHLKDGESVQLSFQYTITDNHGATDVATVTFLVDGKGVVTPPPPQAGEYFPDWAQDISHITLVFEKTAGDTDHGRTPADGYYTLKVDNWTDGLARDVDDVIERILANLDALPAVQIDSDTDLLGVIIKGGLQITSYYAYGEYDSNGEAADVLPVGIALSLNGTKDNEGGANQIDYSIDYGGLMII